MTDKPDVVAMSQSFQPRQWFPHGFDADCGGKIMWVYRPEDGGEHTLWLVGFFYPTGEWFTDSTFDDKEKAVARVNYLNGGQK